MDNLHYNLLLKGEGMKLIFKHHTFRTKGILIFKIYYPQLRMKKCNIKICHSIFQN